jgi:hypothetical protein
MIDVFMAHSHELIALRDRINKSRPTFTELVEGF